MTLYGPPLVGGIGYALGHTRGKGDGYREARADYDYAEYMGRTRGWP